MAINITRPIGIVNGAVSGIGTEQQSILDAFHSIGFIRSRTTLRFMNNGTTSQKVTRWENLIGDFQWQFMVGLRGTFASERGFQLNIQRPDNRIDPGGRTLAILNRMLDARLLVSVDIARQRVSFIENGTSIRNYRVTSGARGSTRTPVGLFKMHKLHESSDTVAEARNYSNNQMQWPVYFTEYGHALHSGVMKDHDSIAGSHGCVRQTTLQQIGNQSYAEMLWRKARQYQSNSTGDFINNAFVFVFDRPNVSNHGARRGDIRYWSQR